MVLQTHVCKQCGEQFEAHGEARTAQMGYCSRTCMNSAGFDTP